RAQPVATTLSLHDALPISLLAGVRAKLAGRYLKSDSIAGTVSSEWAEKLGLSSGVVVPVGAFDAHWDAIGAGIRIGDVVNVVGRSEEHTSELQSRSDLVCR